MEINTAPKPFVFVLMPFAPEFDDVYELGIKPACVAAGAYAERIDEQLFQSSILQRIYNQIAKADIIVSDLTGKNPNVFYEVGYAHALGKPVVLLTRNADDIPFDLKDFPHIIYQGRIVDLIPELEKRVRWIIQNPESRTLNRNNIYVQINSIPLKNCPTIACYYDSNFNSLISTLRIDINNSADHEISIANCQIGLITPLRFHTSISATGSKSDDLNVVSLQNGRNLHLPDDIYAILPGAWETCYIRFIINKDEVAVGETEDEIILRIFTNSGYYDYPFNLKSLLKNSKDDS